jgi:hypothetical protein
MMDTSHHIDEISCPWCGGFSPPAATCDLCGSPMSDGHGARVGEGVTVLVSEPAQSQPTVEPAPPVVSIPEPSVPVERLIEPLRFQAVLAAATARARSASPEPNGLVRYRRSLQVRWTIEAVNH